MPLSRVRFLLPLLLSLAGCGNSHQDSHVWRPPIEAAAWQGYELAGVDI